ncbi:unnamed protein product, partial [Ectocarpus fasciculatus]
HWLNSFNRYVHHYRLESRTHDTPDRSLFEEETVTFMCGSQQQTSQQQKVTRAATQPHIERITIPLMAPMEIEPSLLFLWLVPIEERPQGCRFIFGYYVRPP